MIKFDEYQQAFIDHPPTANNVVCLEAVAGSGKTTTAVKRIERLIKEGVHQPEEIVFITFSNKSAHDLAAKYETLTGLAEKPFMSTVHSFAMSVLDAFFDRKPSLLNEWSSALVVREAIIELGLCEKYNMENKRIMTMYAYQALEIANYLKSNLIFGTENYVQCLDRLRLNEYPNVPETQLKVNDIALILEKYEEYKLVANQFDYADIVYKLYLLLNRDPEALAKVKAKYTTFFIDECQDLDTLLFRLVYLLSEQNNLYLIYDKSQTIYGFRWAAPYHLDRDHLEPHFEKVNVYPLAYNYRSTKNIVNIGNKVRELQKAEVLAKASQPDQQGSVRYIKVQTDLLEGERIVELIQEQGGDYKNYAVIAKTNNYLKTVVEPSLAKANIPYVLATKNRRKMFDKPITRMFFNFLSLLVNPEDKLALIDLGGSLKGIGDSYIESLKSRFYRQEPLEGSTEGERSKYQRIEALGGVLAELSHNLVNTTFQELMIRLLGIIQENFKLDNSINLKEITTIQKTLHNMLYVYHTQGVHDLKPAFERLLLDFTEVMTEKSENAVTLMTIHGSKGLEFPVTFVGGNAKGSKYSDLEEDLCALYVQVSRAQETLYILDSKKVVENGYKVKDARNSVAFRRFKTSIGICE